MVNFKIKKEYTLEDFYTAIKVTNLSGQLGKWVKSVCNYYAKNQHLLKNRNNTIKK